MSAGATVWPAPFVDTKGNKRAGLEIKVYLPGQGPLPDGDGSLALAQLYTDDALTVLRNQTTDPVLTNADGNEVDIKAAPGRYEAYVDGETIPLVVVADPVAAAAAAALIDGGTP